MLISTIKRNAFGLVSSLIVSSSVFAASTAVPSVEIDNNLCLPKAGCLLSFPVTVAMLDKTGAVCTTVTVPAASSTTYVPTGTCLTNGGVVVVAVTPQSFGSQVLYSGKSVKLTATAGTNFLATVKVAGTTDPVWDSTNTFIVDTAGVMSLTEVDTFRVAN